MRDSMRPMDPLGSMIMDPCMDPCIELQVLQDEHLFLERPPSLPRDFRRFERVLDAVHHTVSFEGIKRLVIAFSFQEGKEKMDVVWVCAVCLSGGRAATDCLRAARGAAFGLDVGCTFLPWSLLSHLP